MIVAEDYNTPCVKLDLYGGTSGTYAGFDRFGRVRNTTAQRHPARTKAAPPRNGKLR